MSDLSDIDRAPVYPVFIGVFLKFMSGFPDILACKNR